jgi:chloramphenicol 3-O phosphotransferase
MPGRVIFLNGTSSTGKTSLVWCLQDILTETWVSVGIDQFIRSSPLRLFGSEEGHRFVDGPRIVTGPEFRRIHRAWHRATTTLLDQDLNVIVDEVLLDRALAEDWRAVLSPYAVLWVAVRCDPELAEERASRRGDRALGMARIQADYVHDGVAYDLEVDTGALQAMDCARLIKVRIEPLCTD